MPSFDFVAGHYICRFPLSRTVAVDGVLVEVSEINCQTCACDKTLLRSLHWLILRQAVCIGTWESCDMFLVPIIRRLKVVVAWPNIGLVTAID